MTQPKPPMPIGTHGSDSTISAATTLTGAPADGGWLRLQALTQNIRFTCDGATTPTSTVGFQVVAGKEVWVPVGASGIVQVIEETSGAAVQWQWHSW